MSVDAVMRDELVSFVKRSSNCGLLEIELTQDGDPHIISSGEGTHTRKQGGSGFASKEMGEM